MIPITVKCKTETALCHFRTVLANVNGKWQMLILLGLEDESLRFAQLKRTVGDITQRVLTENLRSLERDGYLTRTVDAGPPVAVSYALTPLGGALVKKIKPLVMWACDAFDSVTAARAEFESRKE